MEIGGFDANQIVTSLIQIERIPLTALTSRRTAAEEAARAIGALRSTVESFRFASLKLSESTSFDRFSAQVSNESAVSASATAGAAPGSLTFQVTQLASAHGLRSAGTVAASNLAIMTDPTLALATGTSKLGISSVRAGAGLAVGKFDLEVVQSADVARLTGNSPLAATTTISNGGLFQPPNNRTLDLSIDGQASTLTLDTGSFTRQGLADHVNDLLQAQGAPATAGLDSTGRLVFTSTGEGSSARIQITGGTARGDLGLVDATATGLDGIIDVNGNQTVVTDARAGQTVAVDTGAGILQVTLGGKLQIGTTKVTVVGTGSRSLSDVAAAINGAGAGISAAAVRVDESNWRLQLGSTTTGENGEIAVDGAVFDQVGGLVESSAARDAEIVIGEGAGAYTVEANGNTFDNVIAGVSFTAKQVTTAPVTVSVARDDEALASDVSKLVAAANTLLAEIKVQTRYDVANGTQGALANNSAIRRLPDQIRRALGGTVNGIASMIPSDIGIQTTRDGSFTFDKAKFIETMTERPGEVARFLTRGATTPAGVTFDQATADTVTGSYEIEVITAAQRASSARLFTGGASANSRIGVRVGDITATYDVSSGQTATEIVDGLNSVLAKAGLGVVAEADGGGVRLRAEKWGASGNFEINTAVGGAGTWDTLSGVDVAGKIDGVVATGIGRTLSLNALVDSRAAGLSVTIDGGVSGALGTVDYQPGIAARVAEFATSVTDTDRGLLQTANDAADRRVTDFNTQIDRFEDRLFTREANLRRQFSALQTLLEGLQSQGNFISGALASLPTVSRS